MRSTRSFACVWIFVLTHKTTDEAKMKIVLPKTPPILDN